MIKIDNISFSYGKSPFIEGLSTEFKRGRLYGIIGPNGCGKSTLLKLMSGSLSPDNGKILIGGRDLSDIPRKELAKISGIMPQMRPTPDMIVSDYVLCGRFPYRNDKENCRSEDIRITEKALLLTDTAKFSKRRITELSGGERQRVYLALLLAQNTQIVLCDEPATHLDVKGNLSIMKMLLDIKKQDKCVIAVLHDLTSALRFCDEIILMDKGKIIDTGSPEDIVKNKGLNRVFGVECIPVTTENGINYVFI